MSLMVNSGVTNNVANFKSKVNKQNFKSKEQYENPINRGTERNLAVLGAIGFSSLIGVVAGFLATCFRSEGAKGIKMPLIVGTLAGLGSLALTLPSKLYNTKVNAFAKEKEMDVFSRQKSAQNSIYEDINDEIKDNNVPLEQKINHYATVKMADNGNGVMLKSF